MSEDWITEELNQNYRMSHKVKKRLAVGKSDFQKVEVVETESLGVMLFNDDLTMVSERDEFIYHDMITHVPMFTHPHPKRVLVVGGGDGGTAREVLRHPEVEFCKMVEIDALVVESCKKFLPQTSKDLDHDKLELVIEDAVEFMAQTDEKFDVILVDSTDPIGPAQPLFGPEFYQNIFKVLNEGGLVVSQGESPFYNSKMQKKLLSILNQQFPIVQIYNFTNMTYPGGLWSFTLASKKYHPIKDFNQNRVDQSGLEFGYYNSDLHTACFVLPEFMKKSVSEYLKP